MGEELRRRSREWHAGHRDGSVTESFEGWLVSRLATAEQRVIQAETHEQQVTTEAIAALATAERDLADLTVAYTDALGERDVLAGTLEGIGFNVADILATQPKEPEKEDA